MAAVLIAFSNDDSNIGAVKNSGGHCNVNLSNINVSIWLEIVAKALSTYYVVLYLN